MKLFILVLAGIGCFLAPAPAHALTTFHVRPCADDPAGGAEFCSLQRAYNAIQAAGDYDIVVHEAVYNEWYVGDANGIWSKNFPGRTIRVVAAPGEHPVFDGQGGALLFHVRITNGQDIGLHFEGLHIRNYRNPVALEGWVDSAGTCQSPDTFHRGVVIRNNVFERIGDIATDFKLCGDGYGAIVAHASRGLLIEGNAFLHITNCLCAANQLHVVYANFESDDMVIRNNFIDDASGDPFKFRWGTSNVLVTQNYVHRAYNDGPAQSYRVDSPNGTREEPTAANIRLEENLIVHPSETETSNPALFTCYLNEAATCSGEAATCSGSAATCPTPGSRLVPCPPTFTSDTYTRSRFDRRPPAAYDVVASTAADFDGDGREEPVIALSSNGVTRVLRPKLEPHILGEVIWSSRSDQVLAMAAGDFDGNGRSELLLAIRRAPSGLVEVVRGSGAPWRGGDDLGTIYRDVSGAVRSITAMTSGDYDKDGRSEVLIAFRYNVSPAVTEVFRGDGRTADRGANEPNGATNHGSVYTSPSWAVTAMTTADFDGDGDLDVATAFAIPGESRVYVGDGSMGLTNKKRIFTSTTDVVTAMTSGDGDGDGHADLMTALRAASGTTNVWRGNGWNHHASGPDGVRGRHLEESPSFAIQAMVMGDFRSGGADEMATVFRRSNAIQIWHGDGTTSTGTYWKYLDQAIGEYRRPEDVCHFSCTCP